MPNGKDKASVQADPLDTIRANMTDRDEYIALASLFKLFGDGSRVQLLHALEQGELCVSDLARLLQLTESAVSHQLKALRLANLVKFRREAQTVYYSLADSHVKELLDVGFEHLRE